MFKVIFVGKDLKKLQSNACRPQLISLFTMVIPNPLLARMLMALCIFVCEQISAKVVETPPLNLVPVPSLVTPLRNLPYEATLPLPKVIKELFPRTFIPVNLLLGSIELIIPGQNILINTGLLPVILSKSNLGNKTPPLLFRCKIAIL